MDSFYIREVLNGNIDAFKFFVDKYKDLALSLAFSILKNRYLSEEAVQESFIITFDKLNTFKHNSKFKTWFCRIVINECLKKVKNELVDVDLCNISEAEISHIDDTMNNLLVKERQFYIDKVFKKLNHKESLVLELFYLKEFSIKEIAQMTNWSISKVKMLNLRGKQNFYIQLKNILNNESEKIK